MNTLATPLQPLTAAERRRVWIGTIAVLVILIVAVSVAVPYIKKALTLRFYTISSPSMEPTIYEGDRIAVDESYYKHHSLKDGDIVTFKHGDGTVLIKRVSAVAGETIECTDGQLIRNGVMQTETYLHPPAADVVPLRVTFAATTIPPGEIFVTGDWRDRSFDSRIPEFGPVLLSDVTGKIAFVYVSSHQGQFGRKF